MADRSDNDGPTVLRWLKTFGRFWWDFLIGDTPELFVGVVVIIGAVAVLCLHPGLRTAAAILAPVLIVGLLTVSVWSAARRGTS